LLILSKNAHYDIIFKKVLSSLDVEKIKGKPMSSTEKNCPLCGIVKREVSAVVIKENKDILAFMDLYPATPGHILIIPKRHIENIYHLPADLGARIMGTAIELAGAIKYQLSPQGLNLIQANETAAGQTIFHFHLHIVPRYDRDPVFLKFGHGNVPARAEELEQIASRIRSGLVEK
jgi:histidine triad (HIT) family protein